MAWRDRAWFIAAVETAEGAISNTQGLLARAIECGEYEVAQQHCETLRTQLSSLNKLTNEFADKFGG